MPKGKPIGSRPKGFFVKSEIRSQSQKKSKENREKVSLEKTTHGVWRYLATTIHTCKTCILAGDGCPVYGKEIKYNGETVKVEGDTPCIILRSYQDRIVSELHALPQIEEGDSLLVEQLVRNLSALFVGNLYLNKKGMFLLEGSNRVVGQPVLSQITKFENLANKNLDQLGVGPRTRRMLGLVKSSLTFAELISEFNDNNTKEK